MKVSGKGVAVIILFVVVIPLGTACFAGIVWDGNVRNLLTRSLSISYPLWLLLYVCVYLPVAFALIYLFRDFFRKFFKY